MTCRNCGESIAWEPDGQWSTTPGYVHFGHGEHRPVNNYSKYCVINGVLNQDGIKAEPQS